MNADAEPRAAAGKSNQVHRTAKQKIWAEFVSWCWVIIAFVGIEAGVAEARMIPTGSMEPTVLVGDHLLVSRMGYEIGVPFTSIRQPLWREPKRQQIIVFQAPLADENYPDFIKRCIGVPGDHIKIVSGQVYVNGKALNEPYVKHIPGYQHMPWENLPADADAMTPYFVHRPEWASELAKNTVNGEIVVPPGRYFMMGDNRDDSEDSRYWGFASRSSVIGSPLIVYMSIQARDDEVWQDAPRRFEVYADALLHPTMVRWRRLFGVLR